MKLYLGSGPSPTHPQHKKVMGNLDEWTFVDLYINEPHIRNWDATKLAEIEDESVEMIYSSHLLEHIPHIELEKTILRWYSVLTPGGILQINVPDLAWAAKQLVKLTNGQLLEGEYNQFNGERGLQVIFYGSQAHDGEYHKSGFTKDSLHELLKSAGFKNITVDLMFEAHDMGCLIARGKK